MTASTRAATPSPLAATTFLHRHLPGVIATEPEHVLELADGDVGGRQVALAHDEEIGDLEDAGLDRLHRVALSRRTDDEPGIRELRYLDLGLTGTHRLDDDRVEAAGVEHVHDLCGRARRAAEMAARGERTDEDVRVRGVLTHADAIAEHGAAGDGTGRIDGDHRDAPATRNERAKQRVDERRLACARRSGDAEDVRAPAVRGDGERDGAGVGLAALDRADRVRDRTPVAREDPRQPRGCAVHTTACTSPNPISRRNVAQISP